MTDEQVKKELAVIALTTNWGSVERVEGVPKPIAVAKDALALINRLEEEKEQIRKETAKVILQELFDCVNEGAKDKNNHFAFVCIRIGTIIKLKAQEYGVEVDV